MPTPVIAVCMPIAEKVEGDAFHSCLRLDLPRPYHLLDRREVHDVANARNQIVGRLLFDPLLKDVTHLLWIDDDMVFPQDAARRLLAYDLPIVGGLCHARHAPHYAPILLYRHNEKGGYTYRHDFPRRLVEVDATGGAFVLVRRDVFEAIEAKYPVAGEGPFTNRGYGEDVSFCERAKECGYKIYVDCGLEIDHIAKVRVNSEFAKRNRLAEFHPWHPPSGVPEGAPQASIIIPTWNERPEWLREAVRSALTQTVPVEVIVVDDGSDEQHNVQEALSGLPAPADRLSIVRIPYDSGCFHAMNVGINRMRTEYLAILSSDDFYYPNKIERQLYMMHCHEERASFHGFDRVDANGRGEMSGTVAAEWRTHEEMRRLLAQACYINMLTVMIHKSVLDEVKIVSNGQVFDESITISSDWDLWNRIARVAFWLPIPEVLAARRETGENASNRYAADLEKRNRWIAEDNAIRVRYSPRCTHCGVAL